MNRESISENVKRRLYIESMGRCMNPDCQIDLFQNNGDVMEKAHIIPYCDTADNSFENLVILCPTCHEKYDKLGLFTPETIREWKRKRQEEIVKMFTEKFSSYDDLSKKVVPLLEENKTIYENYFLTDKKGLWDKFELKVLINNNKLKRLFENNLDLFQSHSEKNYSNREYVNKFIAHVNEFEGTRNDKEKMRQIIFPQEINSMFGIYPLKTFLFPSTESIECLIAKLEEQDKFVDIATGIEDPYIKYKNGNELSKIYLNDIPRLRQILNEYECFRKTEVRFESLNFALKYMKSRNVNYSFPTYNNLREITINGTTIIFVYKYCLSKMELLNLTPKEGSIIVNLHNWNGSCCISGEAHDAARSMNVELLTMDDFYGYINTIRNQ